MGTFHPLRVEAVDPLTEDSVSVTLTVPPELRSTYRYAAGQHITLRRHAAAPTAATAEIGKAHV